MKRCKFLHFYKWQPATTAWVFARKKNRKSCVEMFDRLSDVATKTKKASFSSTNSDSVSIVRTLYIHMYNSYIHTYIGPSNFGKFACRIN